MNDSSNMLERVKAEVSLVERHLDVLREVMIHQPIGIMRLAEQMDLPYHRIRYSLRVLEQMGYLKASPEGAVILDRAYHLVETLDGELEGIILELQRVQRKNSHNV